MVKWVAWLNSIVKLFNKYRASLAVESTRGADRDYTYALYSYQSASSFAALIPDHACGPCLKILIFKEILHGDTLVRFVV